MASTVFFLFFIEAEHRQRTFWSKVSMCKFLHSVMQYKMVVVLVISYLKFQPACHILPIKASNKEQYKNLIFWWWSIELFFFFQARLMTVSQMVTNGINRQRRKRKRGEKKIHQTQKQKLCQSPVHTWLYPQKEWRSYLTSSHDR